MSFGIIFLYDRKNNDARSLTHSLYISLCACEFGVYIEALIFKTIEGERRGGGAVGRLNADY